MTPPSFVAQAYEPQDDPDMMYTEVQRLVENEKYEPAARLCNKILDIQSHPIVANMLGFCLYKLNKEEYAERVWRGALELQADCVPVLANLANLLRERMRYKQAEELLLQAIRCKPNDHRARHNYATLMMDLGRWDEALKHAKKAVELDGKEIASRHLLSLAKLNAGDFAGGFKLYDARKPLFLRDKAPLPQYTGGKAKVIVRHEQGFGDTIMAARWLPALQEMGADVTIVCPRPLKSLISQSNLAKIHEDGDEDYTHHLWTMDLLPMFASDWNSISGKPYLKANEAMVAEFGSQLPKDKPVVGICWSGGFRPDDIGAFVIDKRRSMSGQHAEQIFDGMDCHVVNLTREWGLPDAIDFGCAVGDFEEQAALLSNLDLVITVDTALAHLSGGLGVNTWVMSRFDACWRWHPYTENVPLYDSVKHFRQPRVMDWHSVIEQVREKLGAFLNGKN